MTEPGTFWAWLGLGVVVACWFAFFAGFLVMRGMSGKETKRAGGSGPGMLLQSAAVLLVWLLWRPFGGPIVNVAGESGRVVVAATAIAAAALAVASLWLLLSAMRTLGRQFAIGPRVIEGHQLIVGGPYARVRNPIYSGGLGLLLATGLAVSEWWAMAAGALIYLAGIWIRIRVEEGLLRSVFGEDFDAYHRYVPALIPRLRIRR